MSSVDDFLIYYRSKHIHTIKRHFQHCLNKINKWAMENGFKFSKEKSKMYAFLSITKTAHQLNSKIPVVDKYKYLGMIVDKKLLFIPHIKYIKSILQRHETSSDSSVAHWLGCRQRYPVKTISDLLHLWSSRIIFKRIKYHSSPRAETSPRIFQDLSNGSLYTEANEPLLEPPCWLEM